MRIAVIGFCLSTSVLPCQYYCEHTLYSSTSNVTRNNKQVVNVWKPSKNDVLLEIEGIEYKNIIIQFSWVKYLVNRLFVKINPFIGFRNLKLEKVDDNR